MNSYILKGITLLLCYEVTFWYSFSAGFEMYVIHFLIILWIVWIYLDERANKEEYFKSYV